MATTEVHDGQLRDQGIPAVTLGLESYPVSGAQVLSSAGSRLHRSVQLKYAVGGIATGIIANGLLAYVLLYYNLVLGLSASLVGAVLAIALVFDALVDPAVGYWTITCAHAGADAIR